MRNTNIQARKLNIIEQLININDDYVFTQVENIINNSLERPQQKRFTKSELIERAKLSNLDIENNNVYLQEQVEQLTKEW